ncbi:MAG TPA: lysylphosphatidylglycerol synthase domain-containing protein [Vicinamibacterales bacterium]|nr:lysylphosphatidylglycerol synthase domain-containing protein [Vicinamibacterales bacterium]
MTRRRLLVQIAAALVGTLLFVSAIRSVGWSNVVDGIGRVGWGLVPILALAGLRFVIRAAAWRLCIPTHARPSLRQAFTAYLSGDAVGNVTPLGLFASEPTKVFLVRHRLATREAAASLAIDLVVYSISAVAMVVVGLSVLLATVPLGVGGREIVIAVLVGLAAGLFAALRILGGTWKPGRGERPPWRARLAGFRDSVFTRSAGHPARLWRVFCLDLLFQAVAVAEVFLTLHWLLPAPPTVAQAVMFSALDRAIVIAFKFVPVRLGVDEWFSGGMAGWLGWDPATGVALALIRKVRSIAWVGVGLALIAAHPSPAGPETGPP